MSLTSTVAQLSARNLILRLTGRSSIGSALCSILGAVLALVLTFELASASCRAPRELVRFSAPLPVMTRAMGSMGSEPVVRIAALGSSSTSGVGASSSKMCYPARLEAELNRRYGARSTFSVINLGVGGELATDMLARIDTEVLATRPHLVIWQTGVNDAIQGVSIDDFKTTLTQGIAAIRAMGADVVFLGMQYYPRSVRVPLYRNYLVTMREVAAEANVPLLNRYGIMKHLIDSAQYAPTDLLAPDQFHQNDLSYGCVSALLADAIDEEVRLPLGKQRAAVEGQSLRMSAAR